MLKNEERLEKLLLSVVSTYEATVPDLIVLARYKTANKDVSRFDIMRVLQLAFIKARYALYLDMWRPPLKDRIPRVEFIRTLPKVVRDLITYELTKIVADPKNWKRRHVYKAYLDEMALVGEKSV